MSYLVADEYRRIVQESIANDFDDNYDYHRFGTVPQRSSQAKPKMSVLDIMKAVQKIITTGLLKLSLNQSAKMTEAKIIKTAENWLNPNVERFQWLYDHLEDQNSKELLILILAYRALGYRRVKLPLNTPSYWGTYAQLEALAQGVETINLGFMGWQAYRLRLDDYGYPIEIFVRPGGVMNQMLLQQYRCLTDGNGIEVSKGDTVIDAGGCYGDTALYFAHKAGETGRIYSSEFMPDNLMIFNRNLALNPNYAKRIKLIQQPLWSTSGESLFIDGDGPAACVKAYSDNPGAHQIKTICIDDLAEQEKLQRLDFIKMDIESSELAALQGAEQSIRRFRPKLAISVYHRLQDFWEIPQWIAGLNQGYRFYLRHFTIHQEETILFARTDK